MDHITAEISNKGWKPLVFRDLFLASHFHSVFFSFCKFPQIKIILSLTLQEICIYVWCCVVLEHLKVFFNITFPLKANIIIKNVKGTSEPRLSLCDLKSIRSFKIKFPLTLISKWRKWHLGSLCFQNIFRWSMPQDQCRG